MDATHALLDELIDYAGLFPPARLDMEPAVQGYARHRGNALAAALGRFVIPVSRLEEFEVAAGPLLPSVPSIDDRESSSTALYPALTLEATTSSIETRPVRRRMTVPPNTL